MLLPQMYLRVAFLFSGVFSHSLFAKNTRANVSLSNVYCRGDKLRELLPVVHTRHDSKTPSQIIVDVTAIYYGLFIIMAVYVSAISGNKISIFPFLSFFCNIFMTTDKLADKIIFWGCKYVRWSILWSKAMKCQCAGTKVRQ